jgi:N-acetyl-alpha-D-muramate 1-phosphate uridylyltransferase
VSLPPVCILAGGLATRLGDRARETPKAILPVAGRPFACWQLELLRAAGARRVVFCIGHLGERIEETLGASPLGLEAHYVFDPPSLAGTAGAIRGARALLGERFLVLYGDTYLRVDYAAVAQAHAASGCPALLTVLRNRNRWDVSNAAFDGHRVTHDKHNPPPGAEWIDYGLGALQTQALDLPGDDLSEIYAALSARGELAGYEATERFYEIGTPDSLAEADAFLSGRRDSGASGQRRAASDDPAA